MTTLLLVRHGETDWNRLGRWQGHSDTPLNARGREQARELAPQLDGVDVVYSSDLARARETAEILAEELGADVRLDARLRERGFGAWEGLTAAEIVGHDDLQWQDHVPPAAGDDDRRAGAAVTAPPAKKSSGQFAALLRRVLSRA